MCPVPVLSSVALWAPVPALATPIHTPPVTPGLVTVAGREDEALDIRLAAEDADGDPLTFEIVYPPGSGTILGAGPVRTFVPDPNFTGRTWFAYTASDGTYTSDLAWIAVDVAPVQDEVWPRDLSVSVAEDGRVDFALQADADPGVQIVWEVIEGPRHGHLSGEAASWVSDDGALSYRPDPDYVGGDRLVVAAYDLGSPRPFTAIVSIDVGPRPDPPGGVVPLSPGPAAIVATARPTLVWSAAEDPDGDPVRYGARVVDVRTEEVVAAVADRDAVGATVSWTIPEPLVHGRTYAWEAWADDGTSTGPVSERVLFRVDPSNAAPPEVVILEPAPGEVAPSASPVFVFSGSEDPDGGVVTYEIEVDVAPTFDTPARAGATRTDAGATVTWDLADEGIALPRFSEAWGRIRAVDDAGATSGWTVVAFRVAGPNAAPTVPTVEPLPEAPDAPCRWRLVAEDPEADRVAYEVTADPGTPGERTGWFGMGAPAAVVKCAEDDRGVPTGWVRAIDEHGAASPWRRVEGDLRIGAGCSALPGGPVGWLPLLAVLGLRRRR